MIKHKIIQTIMLFTVISFPAMALDNFDSYKIVLERNIFDPNRNVSLLSLPKPTPMPLPIIPLEYITLTGVMIAGPGESKKTTMTRSIIFFKGSKPEYSVVLTEGMSIQGFKIGKTQTNQIELVKGNYKINLFVGKSITGNVEKKWGLSDQPKPVIKKTPKPSEDDSDLLKKLLERRKKEI